ncbi:MAG: hypothetical protein HY094_02315 [Candidatus Melainabacteria bacterium]|nr:hypothetical protein [Candidatus Melainabacteria bacterium]
MLNPNTKSKKRRKWILSLIITIVFILLTGITATSQIQLPIPQEFQSLSINSRALEKNVSFTLDSDSSKVTQNLSLDKTGVILHLQPSPKIKDDNTKIRVFATDGTEIETFTFRDNTIFSLVDPEKSYSIIQEVMPFCDDAITAFNLDQSQAFCPDSVAFKIYNNIMINTDTSFKVSLKKLSELYSVAISTPNDIQQLDNTFNFAEIKINTPSSSDSLVTETISEPPNSENITVANLLMLGEFCIVSTTKTKNNIKASDCSFTNNNVQAVIRFNHAFKNNVRCLSSSSGSLSESTSSSSGTISISEENIELPVCLSGNISCSQGDPKCEDELIGIPTCKREIPGCNTSFAFFPNNSSVLPSNINLLFFYPANIFTKLNHEYLFKLETSLTSKSSPTEINNDSSKKLFLDSYNLRTNLNLGSLSTRRSPIKKNTFKLTDSIELNNTFSKTTLSTSSIESAISPFTNKTNSSTLSSINIAANQNNLPNTFSISSKNNIIIKDLADPTPTPTSQTMVVSKPRESISLNETIQSSQTTPQDLNILEITSYIPVGKYNIEFSRTYTFVEKNIAPTVDDSGTSKEIVNNKSKVDFILRKKTNDISISEVSQTFPLNTGDFSQFFDNKLIKDQLSLSGFLIPPDFRPVLEEGYRATVELSMIIDFKDGNIIKITCSDLKTKDEPPLTNFFKFSSIPVGLYDANIRFDASRKDLFNKAGILKTNQ